MDGIEITQVVDSEPPVYLNMSAPALTNIITSESHPFDGLVELPDNDASYAAGDKESRWEEGEKGLEAKDIADMIRINEGLEQPRSPSPARSMPRSSSPQFKHLDKLTPNIPLRRRMLSTKTLKKSFFKKHLKRKGVDSEEDDSDAFVEPLRKKFRESAEIKGCLAEEKRQLKLLRREKKLLELETKKLKKARLKQVRKLQREAQLLTKLQRIKGLKKRGRPLCSGKKFRQERLALEDEIEVSDTSSEDEKELTLDPSPSLIATVVVKTRSGRTRKTNAGLSEYFIHSKAANFVYTGGLDRSNITTTPDETVCPTPVRIERRGRKKGWRKALDSKVPNPLDIGVSDSPSKEAVPENLVGPPTVRIERRGRKKGWRKAINFKKGVNAQEKTAEGISNQIIEEGKTSVPVDGNDNTASSPKLKPIPQRSRRARKEKLVMSYKTKKRRRATKKKQIDGYGTEINFVEKEPNMCLTQGPAVNLKSPESKKDEDVVHDHNASEVTAINAEVIDTPCSSVNAADVTTISDAVPNGVTPSRARRVGLSKKAITPLEDELSELRSAWGGLMGTPSPEKMATDHPKLEDGDKIGVENDSPPIAVNNKALKPAVSRSRKRKLKSVFTAKKRIRNRVSTAAESTEPLKEKQNIDEALKSQSTATAPVKIGTDELPQASTPHGERSNKRCLSQAIIPKCAKTKKRCLSQVIPSKHAIAKVVLTKNHLVESSLSQQREKERQEQSERQIQAEAENVKISTSEKLSEPLNEEVKTRKRRISRHQSESQNEKEKRKTRTSVRINKRDSAPLNQVIVTKNEESSPRRSGREIKFTEKMVELITQEKQEKKINAEKMECYEHLLKRGSGSTSETLASDLGAKVEALSKFFECSLSPGDVVWTRIGDYPFWPSLVIQDPFCFDEYSKVKCLDGEPQVFVHVQFLHDRGRRGWVPIDYLMAFQGQAHFNSIVANEGAGEAVATSNDAAFRNALIVTEKHSKGWAEAVKEGESFLHMTPARRLLNIRRRNPLERYGECSSLVGDVTEIPDELETLPLPPPIQEVVVKKSRTKTPKLAKLAKLEETVPKEEKEDEEEVVTQRSLPVPKIKREKKKARQSKSKVKKIDKILDLAEKIRAERAPSEDSTSAFEKESTSSLELISLETKRAKKFLFKGVGDEKICDICRGVKNELAVKCNGKCQNFFHPSCLEEISSPSKKAKHFTEDWMCEGCASGQNPCFVCKEAVGTRQMCLTAGCGKFYHHSCLKLFPQTKFNRGDRKNIGLQRDPADAEDDDLPPEILVCSLHTCHTCSSDNPAEGQTMAMDKLVRCVKCPTSYHSGYFCVPAGTEVKTTSQILCGKHFEPPPKSKVQYHFNINWCFLCCKGGSLICCDSCPSSFHADCLKIKPPEGSFICEECESGRFPLHGEIVWTKLAAFRWWPARVLYPQEIPQNLANMKRRQCEFAIQFYGTRDYQWINRGRAYLYQEGDAMNKLKSTKGLDIAFERAVAEANIDFFLRKNALSQRQSSKSVGKPPPYVKIKTNKYIAKVLGGTKEPLACECDPRGEAPCSPNSNCLNRMLLFECHPGYCPAGNNCMNRCFEKRLYPPLQAYKTSEKGWGLRSKVDLAKGQFIIEYVGEVIDEEEFKERLQKRKDDKDNNFYFLTLDGNRFIDAGPRGNLARFMNHSCDPNCETQKWTVNGLTRVGLFAMEDIPKETELTFNYNLDCLGDERKKECHCGSTSCSGFIGSKPIKVEAEPKISRRRKKVKSNRTSRIINKTTDSACFKCGEGGELMLCDAVSCARACHVACAGLSSWPNEPWYCASHKCAICNKATKRCCSSCGVAYCSLHTEGYIYTDQSNVLFCSLHINKNKMLGQSRRSSYLSRRELDGVTSSTGSVAGDLSEKDSTESIKEDKAICDPLELPDKTNCNCLPEDATSVKEEGECISSTTPDVLENNLSVSIISTPVTQEDTGSEYGMEDLVPATEFSASSPVIFTDPDGRIIDIDPVSFMAMDTSPTKRPKKLTNIPRAKIFGLKSPLPQVAE